MKLHNRTDIIEGGPEVGGRHHHNRRDHMYNFNDDRSSLSGGSSGGGYGRDLGGHDPGRPSDDMPVLSERDRKELMNLANENISMDFILEMKEAFQLFDKVSKAIYIPQVLTLNIDRLNLSFIYVVANKMTTYGRKMAIFEK